MNKNVKGIIVVVVIILVVGGLYLAYRKFFGKSAKMKEGYAKNSGDWVGCGVQDYDKKYYSMQNTSGGTIYVEKDAVQTRPSDKGAGLCADAIKPLTVKYLA
jgi:hypothetical protein